MASRYFKIHNMTYPSQARLSIPFRGRRRRRGLGLPVGHVLGPVPRLRRGPRGHDVGGAVRVGGGGARHRRRLRGHPRRPRALPARREDQPHEGGHVISFRYLLPSAQLVRRGTVQLFF